MNLTQFAQTELGVLEEVNSKGKDTGAWEILILLLGAYLLGLLTYWLIHRYMHEGAEKMAAAAPVARKKVAAKPKKDDLTVVEGIGPKINELLNDSGIETYAELASSSRADIKEILDNAGPRYRMHEPRSWIKQAKLAEAGKFDELDKLKDELTAGR